MLNPLQRPLQVLHGIRDAESQMPFTEFSKRSPRKACHAYFFEESIGQRFRFPSSRGNAGKNVKGSTRNTARESLDPIERGHEHIPPPLELRAHVLDRSLIAAQGFNPRPLRKTRSARIGVCHQSCHLPRQVGPHYAVPHTPSSHGV